MVYDRTVPVAVKRNGKQCQDAESIENERVIYGKLLVGQRTLPRTHLPHSFRVHPRLETVPAWVSRSFSFLCNCTSWTDAGPPLLPSLSLPHPARFALLLLLGAYVDCSHLQVHPHRHIVRVFGICLDAPDNSVRLVMDRCDDGSLLEAILRAKPSVCAPVLPCLPLPPPPHTHTHPWPSLPIHRGLAEPRGRRGDGASAT
jgi:hypothetical protein